MILLFSQVSLFLIPLPQGNQSSSLCISRESDPCPLRNPLCGAKIRIKRTNVMYVPAVLRSHVGIGVNPKAGQFLSTLAMCEYTG